jgi:DNA mismatch endonuclease, patch repair protein
MSKRSLSQAIADIVRGKIRVVDTISKRRRSKNMAAIRSKDTAPELLVRRIVHGLGYRFVLHKAGLPGKPDLVLPRHKAVIFVHGCFWHQHARRLCLDGRTPKSNLPYWLPKLSRNVKRDARHRAALGRLGWRSLVIWDCQSKDPDVVATRIERFLKSPRVGKANGAAARNDRGLP